MNNSLAKIPFPENEPVLSYAPNTPERKAITDELKNQLSRMVDIPIIINGEEIRTNNKEEIRCPHDHAKILGYYHKAGKKETDAAIKAALEARKTWSKMSGMDRASIFLRAAELLSGKYRYVLNAATMLGQSKTVIQAEIDSACELIDFWRFNPYYMQQIYAEQPASSPGVKNSMEHRPLEGFVFAVTPFNFTSIGGNLPTAPAMMGNVVLWKPASTSILSSYYIMKILMEAGLPKGVINFIPGKGSDIGQSVFSSPELAGIHFTGSTQVFKSMWETVGKNIYNYKYYPRIVGETGGKDFIFVYRDANVEEVVTALIRGAFEYQGQKCSAASRAYIPDSLWPAVKKKLLEDVAKIKIGDVNDFSNFMGAVIDKNSFNSIKTYIEIAKGSNEAKIICGGEYNDSKGYFIQPTIIEASNPKFKTMEEEIFGPVLTIYVYHDSSLEQTLDLVDTTSPYALTGAVFCKDRDMITKIASRLENAAGNFYINDKPTGAVVGQQPFGGARASGTNDKAGSYLNLIRWVSPRTIKETFIPARQFDYPSMK
ncbi:MAG: L-glutamate gamma-semialdehyde dehydrogenase [Proteobacteria bacterium]|nr:L-glutamate gamma-semialdehyde dehydrogenase [Pseudomonadota bacterium]